MNVPINIDRLDYLRVTQVLAPFSGLAHIPTHILEAAAERGTKVHCMCEAHIQGFAIPKEYDVYSGYFESFLKWMNGSIGTRYFISHPGRMYDDENRITGECDAIYRDDEGLCLVDFKTSAKAGKTWPLQGEAYAHLLEISGIKVEKIKFIKLDKKGAMPQVFDYSAKDTYPGWWECLKMYRAFFDTRQEPFEDII